MSAGRRQKGFTYVAVLIALGPRLPSAAVAFIIFSDPAALGFFFLGGLMMLERSEGVRPALAVTPLRIADYLGAKALTLTLVALCASLALYLAAGHTGTSLTCGEMFRFHWSNQQAVPLKPIGKELP